jgi:hypothetical protein
VAAVNSSIYPDDVQVRDIGLEQLQAFGWTAAAAVRWACYGGLTPAQEKVLTDAWEFSDRLAQQWTDWRPPYEEMRRFLAGPAAHRTGFNVDAVAMGSAYWRVDFWVSGGVPSVGDGRLLRWWVRLGRLAGQRFLEYLITADIDGRPLTVRVQPSRGRGHPMSYPWHLEFAKRRADEREQLQAIDVAELDPIVLMDNRWPPRFLAESLMAQLIDWHFRVRDQATAAGINCPALDGEALAWWIAWLQKISRNPDIGLFEAIAIAKRTVRPATPAGHHKYWRKSLRRRSEKQLQQACGLLGISRSAAYARLKRCGRHARDFESNAQLTEFLRNQAPTRRLADDQRELIDALIENGMKPETARKQEYRLRHLPEPERQKRLLKTLAKLAATTTKNDER